MNFTNKNQDARCVTFQATTLDLADTLRIRWGTTTYVLTKPTSSATVITGSAGRFRADLVYDTANHTITWNIKLNVTPNTIGSTSMVVVTVLAGNVTLASNLQASSVIAYGSSYKTGLAPNTYVSALLSSMATTGYTFTAYDWNDTQITATTTTKVATGIKIVQRNTAGKIVHVYYLVLFGDVTGSGDVGDGLINATDSMEVLKEINREEAYLGAITKLAADVDHNNSITQNDADIILGYVVGNATINQNSTITEAVDETCYFQTAVAF